MVIFLSDTSLLYQTETWYSTVRKPMSLCTHKALVDTVLCQCTVRSLGCALRMTFEQLYSTAFTISIFTSFETSYSLAEAKGGSKMPHLRSVQWYYTAHACCSTTLRPLSAYISPSTSRSSVSPRSDLSWHRKKKSDRNVLTPSDSLRHTLVSLHDAGRFVFHHTETRVIAWLSRLASHQ